MYIVNILLMGITLGLYYPWAKAKVLRYMHSETELEGERFVFHGTGQELFIGFLKFIGIVAALMATMALAPYLLGAFGAVIALVLYLGAILVGVPYAIHGSMRYNTSRTSWNEVHFGYRGELWPFVQKFVGGQLLTMITIGIYGAWFVQDVRKYIINNLRFGDVTFKYEGKGMDFFLLNLKGIVLTICTLGIYIFWYSKDLFQYQLDNTYANQKGDDIKFSTTVTGVDLLVHGLTNALLIVFTLGIGMPWAQVRTLRFIYSHIVIEGNFNPEKLRDTEAEYRDALGEDMADAMDVSVF